MDPFDPHGEAGRLVHRHLGRQKTNAQTLVGALFNERRPTCNKSITAYSLRPGQESMGTADDVFGYRLLKLGNKGVDAMIRFHQRRGFTLVEMLVVMGIIVLITAGGDAHRARGAEQGPLHRCGDVPARLARDRPGPRRPRRRPRGLRLIVDTTKPAGDRAAVGHRGAVHRIAPGPGLQPEPAVPDTARSAPVWQMPALTPRVEFRYTVAARTGARSAARVQSPAGSASSAG